jgi:GT2 family glycosyltransferase
MVRLLYDRFAHPHKQHDVLFVSGACFVTPREVFTDIGGYDPEYFLTVSDVADIGMRLRRRGYRSIHYPVSRIFHYGGRSNSQVKLLTQVKAYTGDIYYVRKHYGILQAMILRYILKGSAYLRAVIFYILGMIEFQYKAKAEMYRQLVAQVE